jgi:ABC-type multidrug transport system permease subunit
VTRGRCGFGVSSLGGGLAAFSTFLAILVPSGCLGSAIVFLCAVLLPSQDLAFAVGSGAVTLSLAVSGAFVPLPRIPSFASWLQWVSPVKYTFQVRLWPQLPRDCDPAALLLMVVASRLACHMPGTHNGSTGGHFV